MAQRGARRITSRRHDARSNGATGARYGTPKDVREARWASKTAVPMANPKKPRLADSRISGNRSSLIPRVRK